MAEIIMGDPACKAAAMLPPGSALSLGTIPAGAVFLRTERRGDQVAMVFEVPGEPVPLTATIGHFGANMTIDQPEVQEARNTASRRALDAALHAEDDYLTNFRQAPGVPAQEIAERQARIDELQWPDVSTGTTRSVRARCKETARYLRMMLRALSESR
jgi:hypothetical protein